MKKYKTIVIDPPWEVTAGLTSVYIGNNKAKPLSKKSSSLNYSTLNIEEIKLLPVKRLSDKNAHLYLWTINKYIPQAYEIVREWGFNPSALLIWCKNPRGFSLGGTFGLSTEYCLFATNGRVEAKKKINRNWWEWKRPYKNGYPYHSAKPDDFYNLIQEVSSAPYLELFARKLREGWDVWGNEVESDIEL